MPVGIDDARAEKDRDGQAHPLYHRQQFVVAGMAVVEGDDEGFLGQRVAIPILAGGNEVVEADDIITLCQPGEGFFGSFPAYIVIQKQCHFIPLNDLPEYENQTGIAEQFVEEFFHSNAVGEWFDDLEGWKVWRV